MITFFSGTPSSGKSYEAVQRVLIALRFGKHVIANFPFKFTEKEIKRGYQDRFHYVPNNEFTIEMLLIYAIDNDMIKKRAENQVLVVYDEAGGKFNPKATRSDLTEWIDFFSQHAKIGFNIILVAQSRAMIDRQVYQMFEYEVKHRKINRFGPMFLLSIFGITIFVSIEYWAQVREKVGLDFIIYRKSVANHYDRFRMFDGFKLSDTLIKRIKLMQGGEERLEKLAFKVEDTEIFEEYGIGKMQIESDGTFPEEYKKPIETIFNNKGEGTE